MVTATVNCLVMDLEKLIEAVREYRCLWDVSSVAYKDKRKRENSWKEVALQVGNDVSADECSSRWKAIRDKFVREVKKIKAGKSGDAGPPYTPTWPLFSLLEFITDTIKHRKSHTNLATNEMELEQYNTPENPESQVGNQENQILDPESQVNNQESQVHNQESHEDFTCDHDTQNINNGSDIDESYIIHHQTEVSRGSSELEVQSVRSVSSPQSTSKRPRSSTPQPFSKRRKGTKHDDGDSFFVKELTRLEERRAQRDERREERRLHKQTQDEDEIFGHQVTTILKRFTSTQKSRARIKVLQVLDDIEFQHSQDT